MLGTDGLVRFIDVVEGKVCCIIEPANQKQAYSKMAVDSRGNYSALITREGEVRAAVCSLVSRSRMASQLAMLNRHQADHCQLRMAITYRITSE